MIFKALSAEQTNHHVRDFIYKLIKGGANVKILFVLRHAGAHVRT